MVIIVAESTPRRRHVRWREAREELLRKLLVLLLGTQGLVEANLVATLVHIRVLVRNANVGVVMPVATKFYS